MINTENFMLFDFKSYLDFFFLFASPCWGKYFTPWGKDERYAYKKWALREEKMYSDRYCRSTKNESRPLYSGGKRYTPLGYKKWALAADGEMSQKNRVFFWRLQNWIIKYY